MMISLDPFAAPPVLDRARASMLDSRSPRAVRVIARLIGVALALVVAALIFAPWQQSVPALGRVIAYAPLERQQVIEAPIEGLISDWYVQEGERVMAGDVIAELSDNDPEILARIQRERNAAFASKTAAAGSVEVAKAKISSLELAREAKQTSAALRVDMARNRLDGAQQKVDAAKIGKSTAKLNLDRQRALFDEGLTSKRSLELAEMAAETKRADLEQAEANLKAAKGEVKAQRAEREHVGADNNADIEGARDSLRKAESNLAKAEAEVQKIDTRLARQQRMSVIAPRTGTILRILAKPGGQMLKAGSPVAMFVPDITGNAVELWAAGKDGPLITPGRKVRLQFQGWPAVQFVGWPSAAVGTFGGVVEFVDATADTDGRFRVVVSPDPDDEPWPENKWLRQGIHANGWVLLDQVSLGFELWRQFNGFPAAIDPSKGSINSSKDDGGGGVKSGSKAARK